MCGEMNTLGLMGPLGTRMPYSTDPEMSIKALHDNHELICGISADWRDLYPLVPPSLKLKESKTPNKKQSWCYPGVEY